MIASTAYGVIVLEGLTEGTVEPNSDPTITSVSDSPDPVTEGQTVTFSVDWDDADAGENIKVHICKTDSLTAGSCDGGSWGDSASFTTDDPETVDYVTQSGDIGTNNYYVFVCDDEDACSASTSGAFSVKSSDAATPSVRLKGGVQLKGGVRLR